MKKVILTLILFLSITPLCRSQWIQQTVPGDIGILLSIDFINSTSGISGGWIFSGEPRGRAIYTTNEGTNWILANVPDSSHAFVEVKLIDSQTGYIAGAYNQSSEKRPYLSIPDYIKNKYNISVVKHWENIGLSGFINYKAMFLKTTDGGRNWFTYGSLPSQFTYAFAMDFINANTGVITVHKQDTNFWNSQSTILKTINGGLAWTPLFALDTIRELQAIRYIDMNTIFAVGYEGTADTVSSNIGGVILKSTNGGINWSRQFFPELSFADVYFPNSLTGFVIGNNHSAQGLIYKTTDQGVSWNIIDTLNYFLLQGIRFFPGSGTGIVYGFDSNSSYVGRTTNYGNTWIEQKLPGMPSFNLIGGILLSTYNEYLTGGDAFSQAVIYHTTNGGSTYVNQIGNSIPEKFSLFQNYPNPFNPNTIISYELRVTSFASLKVFDILGNKVATLVNQKQNAGSHEVTFNGSNLSSGIYFYKLQAGEFVETKRMTLVK